MPTIDEILATRADYSTFLIHLTRSLDGRPAREILETILRERRLRATRAHCVFCHMIGEEDRRFFNVVCFTEAPLHQIKAFAEEIAERQTRLEHYGVVFTKDFIAGRGGNPTFYINTYHRQELRDAAFRLFELARQEGLEGALTTRLLPFISIFGQTTNGGRYDFYWEREWKVVGDVRFGYNDVVVGLCPEDEIDDFQREFEPIRFIAPGWGIDKIILHLRA